jgi:hypothetical protein
MLVQPDVPGANQKKSGKMTARRITRMGRIGMALLSLALGLEWASGPESVRAGDREPSPEELRALLDRVISNQHRDDAALEEYERIERRRVRQREKDTAPSEDKTFRVIPSGTGNARIVIEENGRPVDQALYRKQLENLEQALTAALDPAQPKQKQAAEKFAKRMRERREMVDAVRNAFRYTWLGREKRNGRTLAKFRLDPNPEFKPTSRNTSLFANIRATIWVDETAGQLARVEAEIFRDIYFVGGLLGKVYRGGRFVMEQAEVAPGIWLPTLYDYNFAGRKFLYGLEVHELTEVRHYRRIGLPREALAAIRRELTGSTRTAHSDP